MPRDRALDRLIGQVLAARYRLIERVGSGAMGTVFRAEHVKVGRKLAVKVLHSQMMRNEKYRRRFDREAELAGRLHHPNVASVLDVGITPEGLRYLVMEYAEGPTLTELIRTGPITHNWSWGNQYVSVPFTVESNGKLQVDAPPLPALAVAGDYMLYVVSSAGRPSPGVHVQLALHP